MEVLRSTSISAKYVGGNISGAKKDWAAAERAMKYDRAQVAKMARSMRKMGGGWRKEAKSFIGREKRRLGTI